MADDFENRLSKLLAQLDDYSSIDHERMTLKQAAAYCALSIKSIRRAIQAGELKATNVGTVKRVIHRLSRSAIDEWMRAHEGQQVKRGSRKSQLDA